MKRDKWLSCLIAGLFAFVLSAAGIACLVTGFGFTDVNLTAVLVWCLVCSVAFPFAFTVKKQLWCAGALALAAGFLWRWGSLSLSAEVLLNRLSLAYGWPEIAWSGRDLESGSVTLALCALGTLSAFLTARTVCARKGAALAVLGAALPAAFCLGTTDAVPEPIWILILLVGLGVLMITQSLRRRVPRQANRLTGYILLPVILLMGIVFLAVPQEGYNKQETAAQVVDTLRDWLSDAQKTVEPGKNIKVGGGAVELGKLGSRSQSKREIMTVFYDRGGPLYLRTCAYDTYYGNTWTNLAVPNTLNWPDASQLEPAGTVRITTNYILDMIAFPYYPDGDTLADVTRGINNYGEKQEYSYDILALKDDYLAYEQTGNLSVTDHTQLPSDTYAWAKSQLAHILTDGQTVSQQAAAIAQFVSGSAQYSLQTGKMPADAQGFVQWFIEESETGYCVHFATAAAVLLRAAGIPARYVTGYLVTAQPGVETVVYEKNAHAWVEYWLPGVGWVMLEATPSAALEEQIAPPATESLETEPVVETLAPEAQTDPQWLLLLWIPGVILAVVLQWKLRFVIRRKRLHSGDPAQRAAKLWQEIAGLTRYTGHRPASDAFDLAQKARFSQHGLTEQELDRLLLELERAYLHLRQKPWYKKLYYRLILAIY